MRCVHINIRKATLILLTVLINNVHHSQMHENTVNTNEAKSTTEGNLNQPDVILPCPSNLECNKLNALCIKCDFDSIKNKCIYGQSVNVTCTAKPNVICSGKRTFETSMICQYCYQTDEKEHNCHLKANCNVTAAPKSYYMTNCTVSNEILCFGNRNFPKNVRCNWTGGYRWSTALALSITLGGFGADRFYLGHWQEGIGKLFSFGGLGVWTLIDVILISLHYLGPADGSLYI